MNAETVGPALADFLECPFRGGFVLKVVDGDFDAAFDELSRDTPTTDAARASGNQGVLAAGR